MNELVTMAIGVVALGSIATAIWSIHRLNGLLKDKGREEQKILDKLGWLEKSYSEVAVAFNDLDSKLDLFIKENQEQHHKMLMRIQALELTGCQPVRKKDD